MEIDCTFLVCLVLTLCVSVPVGAAIGGWLAFKLGGR